MEEDNRENSEDSPGDEAQESLLPSIRRRGRLLDRDADFSQSRGRWNIRRLQEARFRRQPIAKTVWDHWFYHLSYQRTPVLMLILFCTYTLLVVLYASVYVMMSRMGGEETHDMDSTGKTTTFCNMGISSFMEALYFSLSTMTTIVRLEFGSLIDMKCAHKLNSGIRSQ